jgi:hypothetical protein
MQRARRSVRDDGPVHLFQAAGPALSAVNHLKPVVTGAFGFASTPHGHDLWRDAATA